MNAIAALDIAGLTISVIAIAIVAAIALRAFGKRSRAPPASAARTRASANSSAPPRPLAQSRLHSRGVLVEAKKCRRASAVSAECSSGKKWPPLTGPP
jgi:hypothetical protein